MINQSPIRPLKNSSEARKAYRWLAALLLGLLLISSTLNHTQAQANNPANADPRRVPPAVLWNVELRGTDVAIGPDGNPVLIAVTGNATDLRAVKVDGVTGVTIWDVVITHDDPLEPKGVAIGADGSPFVVATNLGPEDSDFRILKFNGNTGAVSWDMTYDAGPDESAIDIAVGADGNPVITGSFQNEDFGDIRTAKFDAATGALLWSVSFDGGLDDYPSALAVAADGQVVVAASSDDGTFLGVRLIKLDGATGTSIWNVFYGGSPALGQGESSAIAIGQDGALVITGTDFSSDFAAKIDETNGGILWSRFLGDNGTSRDVAIDSSGNLVMAGTRTVKFDGATGEILWSLAGQGVALNDGQGIAIGPGDRIVITGESTVSYDGPATNIGWVARADNMASDASAQFVATGADGNPVVTGNLVDAAGFRTIKYDAANGAVLWSATYESATGNDSVNAVAIGPDGNPVVVGLSSAEGLTDFRVIKYDGTTGATIWNVVIDSGADDLPQAVAIGSDGHPVVVGSSAGPTDADFRVIKCDGATGAVLWNVTCDSGAPDESAAVAIGPDGNPVLAGTSGEQGDASADFRLIKYDGATGSILWNVTFDSGTAFGDKAAAVAVGPDGNPVLVGTAAFRTFARLHTIKYDGATGGILWHVADTDDSNMITGGVAVGSDNHPLVTVTLGNSIGGVGLRTFRYDKATGSQLSATDFDTGDAEDKSSVAVGPDGNPVVVVTSYPAQNGINLWIVKYLTEVETMAGANVAVELNGGTDQTNGAHVTYAQVTEAGETTFFTSQTGSPLPAGFSIGEPPLYYDISTTATFSPPVTVCIRYEPARFVDPSNVRLLHFENGGWADVTTSNDTINHIACGQVGSFSMFAVAEVVAGPPVVYDFTGFFPPVDNLPMLNSVNSGRAIPVRFSLGGFRGLEIFDTGYPKSQVIPCDSTAPVDGIEETITAGASSLSYDAASDRYTYVWKTDKTWAGTCRQLVVKLKDGTFHRANFKFTR